MPKESVNILIRPVLISQINNPKTMLLYKSIYMEKSPDIMYLRDATKSIVIKAERNLANVKLDNIRLIVRIIFRKEKYFMFFVVFVYKCLFFIKRK